MTHVLDQVIAGKTPRPAYAETLRLPRPEGWEPGRVWFRWAIRSDILTPWGAVFGGYLAALADEAAGHAALSVLEPGEAFGTTDLRITPLRAAREGELRIEGRVLQRGRSTIHVEVDFAGDDGALVAKASAIQVLSRAASA